MQRNLRVVIGLLALFALWGSIQFAQGQGLTGTLTGIVMDKSQAVIPNATVVMTNESSGDVRRTVTNAEGFFSIAAVLAGSYTVSVEAPGFNKWESKGVVFNPGDRRTLSSIVLDVKSATEQVTVEANSDIVTLDSSEKSAVITERQLQNVAVVGRSAVEMIKILPGMAPTGTMLENRPGYSGETIGINGNGAAGKQSALGNFSANGTRGDAMDIVADGAHVSDPGCNCANPVNPNVDMIQEFKVLQGNYDASNSKGPVVMNAIAKSGGRDFHGTGYIYLRDYRFNSNNWELNAIKSKDANCDKEIPDPGCQPKNKYRFPGFNIGGPVLIPGTNFNKNRDKLFFFAGYEYYNQNLDTMPIMQANVPTAAMRKGDFSNIANEHFQVNATPMIDGVPTPIIPKQLIDPGAQILMNLMPLPNIDPNGAGKGYNYTDTVVVNQNMHQFLTRVDNNISDNTKLFVRYNLQKELQVFPTQMWWRNPNDIPYPSQIDGKNVSHSVATSLTHVFSPTLTNETVVGVTYINFPNEFHDPSKVMSSALGYNHPGIYKHEDHIPTVTNWGAGLVTMSNPGGFDPVLFAKKWLVSASDNVSKVYGTHTMKFGAYWEIVTNNQPNSDDSMGVMYFSPWAANNSGNAYADLLRGVIADYQQSNKNNLHNEGYQTFEFYAQDSWKVNPRLTLEYGARFAHLGFWHDREGYGMAIFDKSQYSNNPADLTKLTGLRWHKIDPSVPLSGAKVRPLFVSPRLGIAYDIFGTGRTVLRGGFGAFRYANAQYGTGALDIPMGHRKTAVGHSTTLNEVDQMQPQFAKTSVSAIDPNDDLQPVNYNWNFTISQKLPASTMWEVSYVGNTSRALTNNGFTNINLIPYGAMFGDPSVDPNPDPYRPYQNYQNIDILNHSQTSDYHSLQTTLNRQRGRINYAVSYTFSKVMGVRGINNGGTADRSNYRNSWGPLDYDRTHLFNIAYVIQMPDFARKYMNGNRAGRAIFDGWQFSGISQYASGANIQANYSSNFNLGGYILDRLDANGQPVGLNAKLINGTPDISAQPILLCDPRKNLKPNQYVNGACFAQPTPGHNGSFIFPYIKGPGFINHDLSVFKNWEFSESKKLQFRLSAYNFINHAVWSFRNGEPRLDLKFDQQGKLIDSDVYGIPDTKFGRRLLQFALKFYF